MDNILLHTKLFSQERENQSNMCGLASRKLTRDTELQGFLWHKHLHTFIILASMIGRNGLTCPKSSEADCGGGGGWGDSDARKLCMWGEGISPAQPFISIQWMHITPQGKKNQTCLSYHDLLWKQPCSSNLAQAHSLMGHGVLDRH